MISPKHVAIIMDGNGRWGLKRKRSRNYGHKKGIETVEKIIDEAVKLKIKYLTLFVFSTENWKRPRNEINYLFKLLNLYIKREINNLIKKNIKIKTIGNIKSFPTNLRLNIKKVETLTRHNDNIQINMALNYGSRQEIVEAVNRLKKKSMIINEKNILKLLKK